MTSTLTTKTKPHTVALIAAAGAGTRLGAGIPKAQVRLGGRTLLERSVAAMEASGVVDEIIAIIRPEMLDDVRREIGSRVRVVYGTGERADSVWEGIKAIEHEQGIVLVHDAARALTPADMIRRVVEGVETHKAVIPVLPVADTIKRVEADLVVETPVRANLRAVQTPQGFDLATLRAVNQQYFAERSFEATDDASLMEWAGVDVACVTGDPLAMKITTPTDLKLAELLEREA